MNYAGKIGAVVLALVLMFGIVGLAVCGERIPAGYVGVVYSMSGGTEDETLSQGWKFVSPIKKVYDFTISNEVLSLTGDDAFPVSTSDNANIDISFQMTYRFIEEEVSKTFQKFRGMDGEEIVDSRVKPVLRSKISEVTGDYSMMDIYSGERAAINDAITDHLNKEFGKRYGLVVEDASIVDVHPDAQLQKAIDERVTAMQKKQQAEAEQETIKVKNKTKLLEAQAEADAKIIAAEAEAKANRIIANSITENLLKMEEMEARKKHGWITVKGANTVVTDSDK